MSATLIFFALLAGFCVCRAFGHDGFAALFFAAACLWGLAQEDGLTDR